MASLYPTLNSIARLNLRCHEYPVSGIQGTSQLLTCKQYSVWSTWGGGVRGRLSDDSLCAGKERWQPLKASDVTAMFVLLSQFRPLRLYSTPLLSYIMSLIRIFILCTRPLCWEQQDRGKPPPLLRLNLLSSVWSSSHPRSVRLTSNLPWRPAGRGGQETSF